MSDYLDKIQTQKKDGTPISTVLFQDSAAREDITEIQNELTTDTTTIEGNPLNFTTLSAQTAKSTILSVAPIQDLHGYDKPWVGGAGKNLLPMTVEGIKSINTGGTWNGLVYTYNGVTFTVQTDNDENVIGIYVNGTANANVRLYIIQNLVAGNYIGKVLNGCPAGGGGSTYRLLVQEQSSPYIEVGRDYGNGSTIYDTDKEYLQCFISVNSGVNLTNAIFYPMIRLSTVTDSSFEPYTNICPISGRTEIGILGCGKNLVDANKFVRKHVQTGVANDKWLSFDQYIAYKPNVEYVFTSTIGIQSVFSLGIFLYDDELNYVDSMSKTHVNPNNVSFTIPNTNAHYFMFGFYNANSLANYSFENPLLRLASDADSNFEPYTKSNDLTISFGQTVYGGTLDVENGVLVVDKKYKLYDGSSDEEWAYSSGWSKTNTNVFYSDVIITDVYFPTHDTISITNCNRFEGVSRNTLYDADTNVVSLSGGFTQGKFTVRILKSIASSLEAFETWLASNNIEIVYILNTPITINLTPNTINLLKGVNNISTDGDKITLTYRDGSVATLGDLTSAVDELDGKIDESKILTDTATGDKYILVVTNGVLSVEQISN